MAIDTEIQETLEPNTKSIKDMRRGGSPEPSCQLPTTPALSPSFELEAYRARDMVYRAKRDNRIQMPDRCEVCCSIGKVVAHHPNYDNALAIVWLCCVCHGKLHLGKFMSRIFVSECPPEMFESDDERTVVIETAWQESTHVINNETYIKGSLQTAII